MPSKYRKDKIHLLSHFLCRKKKSFYFDKMSNIGAVRETEWGGLLRWRQGRERNVLTDGGRGRVLDFGLLPKMLWAFHQRQRSELSTLGWLPKECRDAREDTDTHTHPALPPHLPTSWSPELVWHLPVPQNERVMSSLDLWLSPHHSPVL